MMARSRVLPAKSIQHANMPSRPAAYLCLALSMSLVGSYVALSKPLAAALPVFLLAWMRFGIGGWECSTGSRNPQMKAR